ncbi:MAG: hydrogenase 4 subunit F [Sulfurovum sp.]|nr:hydrogenase 4 subunit F [Sulfurovum sp.]
MSIQFLMILVLVVPLGFAALLWFLPTDEKKLGLVHLIGSIASSVVALMIISNVLDGERYFVFGDILFIDSLGGVFLTLIAVTGVLINMYSVKYMQWEVKKGDIGVKDVKLFYVLSHIFLFTMTLSVLANNMAVMWAAVEATTLSSVFMVALHKGKRSTESGWKYIVICSIGLAFALYATILLYGAGHAVIGDGHNAMLWTSLMDNAKLIDPDALKLVFVFALIGYGTKAGLAPTHTWLPDVHSEGPSPASAMLSAVLLKCAMLAIIRFYGLVGNSMVGFEYVQNLMLIISLITIFVAALFILRQHDVKRMFAYHSVEHIGIIAFGFGIGGPLGIFAGLFHSLTHSLTKALAFCASGNIIKIYGTRDMRKMGGLVKVAPVTAVLFGIAICSLAGVPPLAIFASEFMMIKAGLGIGQYVAVALFIIGLAIVFIGIFSHFNDIMFGEPKGEILSKEVELSANLPLIALAVLVIVFGIFSIDSWISLLNNATKIVVGI